MTTNPYIHLHSDKLNVYIRSVLPLTKKFQYFIQCHTFHTSGGCTVGHELARAHSTPRYRAADCVGHLIVSCHCFTRAAASRRINVAPRVKAVTTRGSRVTREASAHVVKHPVGFSVTLTCRDVPCKCSSRCPHSACVQQTVMLYCHRAIVQGTNGVRCGS
jgi:hypothetical protein